MLSGGGGNCLDGSSEGRIHKKKKKVVENSDEDPSTREDLTPSQLEEISKFLARSTEEASHRGHHRWDQSVEDQRLGVPWHHLVRIDSPGDIQQSLAGFRALGEGEGPEALDALDDRMLTLLRRWLWSGRLEEVLTSNADDRGDLDHCGLLNRLHSFMGAAPSEIRSLLPWLSSFAEEAPGHVLEAGARLGFSTYALQSRFSIHMASLEVDVRPELRLLHQASRQCVQQVEYTANAEYLNGLKTESGEKNHVARLLLHVLAKTEALAKPVTFIEQGDDMSVPFPFIKDPPAGQNQSAQTLMQLQDEQHSPTLSRGKTVVLPWYAPENNWRKDSRAGQETGRKEKTDLSNAGQETDLSKLDQATNPVAQVDSIFLDTLHNADQLWRELMQISPLVRNRIAMHDMECWSSKNEADMFQREGVPAYIQELKGLRAAVNDFMEVQGASRSWDVEMFLPQSCGLLVLKRRGEKRQARVESSPTIRKWLLESFEKLRQLPREMQIDAGSGQGGNLTVSPLLWLLRQIFVHHLEGTVLGKRINFHPNNMPYPLNNSNAGRGPWVDKCLTILYDHIQPDWSLWKKEQVAAAISATTDTAMVQDYIHLQTAKAQSSMEAAKQQYKLREKTAKKNGVSLPPFQPPLTFHFQQPFEAATCGGHTDKLSAFLYYKNPIAEACARYAAAVKDLSDAVTIALPVSSAGGGGRSSVVIPGVLLDKLPLIAGLVFPSTGATVIYYPTTPVAARPKAGSAETLLALFLEHSVTLGALIGTFQSTGSGSKQKRTGQVNCIVGHGPWQTALKTGVLQRAGSGSCKLLFGNPKFKAVLPSFMREDAALPVLLRRRLFVQQNAALPNVTMMLTSCLSLFPSSREGDDHGLPERIARFEEAVAAQEPQQIAFYGCSLVGPGRQQRLQALADRLVGNPTGLYRTTTQLRQGISLWVIRRVGI